MSVSGLRQLLALNALAFVSGIAINLMYDIPFDMIKLNWASMFNFAIFLFLGLSLIPKIAFASLVFPRLPIMFALGYYTQWGLDFDYIESLRALILLAVLAGMTLQVWTMSQLYKYLTKPRNQIG